jgi:hypothetical protein
MLRHDTSLFKINVREHHAVARYQTPLQLIGDALLGHIFPSVMSR